VSNPAFNQAERVPTGENAPMSTRTLLVLAAITGFLILGAFAVQVLASR
jgi:hypothetical protein